MIRSDCVCYTTSFECICFGRKWVTFEVHDSVSAVRVRTAPHDVDISVPLFPDENAAYWPTEANVSLAIGTEYSATSKFLKPIKSD